MARWHGTISGKGLPAKALPTARAPRGMPRYAAISLYVLTRPLGIACSARRTRCWNSPHRSRCIILIQKSTGSPSSNLPIPDTTGCISLWKDSWATGKSSPALSNAEAAGFDRSTRMILTPISNTLHMMTTGPYGVDWIVVLFMVFDYSLLWGGELKHLYGV